MHKYMTFIQYILAEHAIMHTNQNKLLYLINSYYDKDTDD